MRQLLEFESIRNVTWKTLALSIMDFPTIR